MPNMPWDGFFDQAVFMKQVSLLPTNNDYKCQVAISNAIATASLTGATSVAIVLSAFSTDLIQTMIPRLVNMGYSTPTLSGTTLTVSWS